MLTEPLVSFGLDTVTSVGEPGTMTDAAGGGAAADPLPVFDGDAVRAGLAVEPELGAPDPVEPADP